MYLSPPFGRRGLRVQHRVTPTAAASETAPGPTATAAGTAGYEREPCRRADGLTAACEALPPTRDVCEPAVSTQPTASAQRPDGCADGDALSHGRPASEGARDSQTRCSCGYYASGGPAVARACAVVRCGSSRTIAVSTETCSGHSGTHVAVLVRPHSGTARSGRRGSGSNCEQVRMHLP